jgi:ABC-type sugar transport system ATPase subunit
MTSAVNISDLDKWFGGTHALRNVSMRFEAGEVHAVAGENGAGKSTLVKILSGVIGASEYTGEVQVDGAARRLHNVRDAERFGIFLVPQELNIVPELRVGEFLFLNREPQHWGLLDTKKLWGDTAKWLDLFQLTVSPVAKMKELSSHQQQLVSIARATTQGVKVLILDEPTASLTERETELLFERIDELRKRGVATIYISHRLGEFERIADVVTVMRDGCAVDSFRLNDAEDTPRRVIKAMVGRDLNDMYPKRPAVQGEPALELKAWSVANPLAGKPALVSQVDLSIRAGEVLGLFGLMGSGASDLARSIFGLDRGQRSGRMLVRGSPVRVNNPQEAMKVGIAYLPAERKRDGLILHLPIATNMSLAALDRVTRLGAVDRRAELQNVKKYIASLNVKCSSVEQPVSQLSGGNQQKVVAAKWLLTEPEIFVLEEPTRGVDVNARIDFYELVNDLTALGKAVLLISTDLPEVLGMSDRIAVMCDGRLVSQWNRGEVAEEEVMLHAAGEHEVYA